MQVIKQHYITTVYSHIVFTGDNALYLIGIQPVTNQSCSKAFNNAKILENIDIVLQIWNNIRNKIALTI